MIYSPHSRAWLRREEEQSGYLIRRLSDQIWTQAGREKDKGEGKLKEKKHRYLSIRRAFSQNMETKMEMEGDEEKNKMLFREKKLCQKADIYHVQRLGG